MHSRLSELAPLDNRMPKMYPSVTLPHNWLDQRSPAATSATMHSHRARSLACQQAGCTHAITPWAAPIRAAAPARHVCGAAPRAHSLHAAADHPAPRFVAALASSFILLQSGSIPAYATAGIGGPPAAAVEATAAAAEQQQRAAAAAAPPTAVCPVGDVAGLFSGNEDEGPEPFTLYGGLRAERLLCATPARWE